MTTNELLTEILQLMEMNFGERYTDYESQVAKITFNGQHYEIFESDLPIFNELKNKLEVLDILSNSVEEMTGLKDFGLPLNKKRG